MSHATIDSQNVFHDRMRQLGLEEFIAAWGALVPPVSTMGDLAFLSDYVPQTGDPQAFRDEVVTPLLGRTDHPLVPRVRRLYQEAHAWAGQQTARIAAPRLESVPATIPPLEREARRKAIQDRLPGQDMDREWDVSLRCVDLAYEMYETNTVKYLAWADCTSRVLELAGTKEDKT